MPVSLPVSVVTNVCPRYVVVSTSLVKNVYGPALPGAIHQFVMLMLVWSAPLNPPLCPHPVTWASPVFAPVVAG
jgi:hypothetical protein